MWTVNYSKCVQTKRCRYIIDLAHLGTFFKSFERYDNTHSFKKDQILTQLLSWQTIEAFTILQIVFVYILNFH